MIETRIEARNEKEMKNIEKKLIDTGYTKSSDCMWVKIYNKGNSTIIINRGF